MAADAPRALFPGSFDPPTLGHLDLIERAVALFGPLLVAVADNPAKSPVFSAAERVGLIEAMCTELPVEVVAFSGLVVDLAADRGCTVLLRGVYGAGGSLPEVLHPAVHAALADRLSSS
jgi:pantetheine-phosphate adenylyltransferase